MPKFAIIVPVLVPVAVEADDLLADGIPKAKAEVEARLKAAGFANYLIPPVAPEYLWRAQEESDVEPVAKAG